MDSVFSRVYSYREREKKNSRENFLIEIFTFCLETDLNFFEKFLSHLEIDFDKSFLISTQKSYEPFGQPDIEIHLKTSDISIIIECKIEHNERQDQLLDYQKILKSKKVGERHLIYLTKYYDYKELKGDSVKFHLLKWADIYTIISPEDKQITNELKHYLKEQGMAESDNFQYQDLASLINIPSSISKMDEVLDGVKPYFESKIGKFSRDASRSTRLQDKSYSNYFAVYKGGIHIFSVLIGYFWWWEDENIFVALGIYLPKNEGNKDAANTELIIRKCLKKWEIVDEDYETNFWYSKLITEFMAEEVDQIPKMIEYLKTGIDQLIELKKENNKIFNKT